MSTELPKMIALHERKKIMYISTSFIETVAVNKHASMKFVLVTDKPKWLCGPRFYSDVCIFFVFLSTVALVNVTLYKKSGKQQTDK